GQRTCSRNAGRAATGRTFASGRDAVRNRRRHALLLPSDVGSLVRQSAVLSPPVSRPAASDPTDEKVSTEPIERSARILEETMITSATMRRMTAQPHWLLWGYLLLIAIAELLTTFVNPQLGLILHALLLLGLMLRGAFGPTDAERRLALALTLAPLIRLLSLTLPLSAFPQS